jgi:hypothetical protein
VFGKCTRATRAANWTATANVKLSTIADPFAVQFGDICFFRQPPLKVHQTNATHLGERFGAPTLVDGAQVNLLHHVVGIIICDEEHLAEGCRHSGDVGISDCE